LVAYKRLDYAIRLFSRTGRKLRVAGDGPEYRALKRVAGPTVEFCGRVSAVHLRELYARSRALIVPGEEDFGITMVESLASGKPVIALGCGGAVEIVPRENPCGGILYGQPSEEDLETALLSFEAQQHEFYPQALQGWAGLFSEAQFQQKMERILTVPAAACEAVPVPYL
jgi:glycosyltransferase involved in cell wall biosynthesis